MAYPTVTKAVYRYYKKRKSVRSSFTYVIAGQQVTFTDTSTLSPRSWLWDFGNGQTSTVQNPVYTYPLEGVYTVTLTALNRLGGQPSASATFTILGINTAPPALGANPVVGQQLAYTPGVWTGVASVSVQAQRRRLGGAWANVGTAWNSVSGTPYTLVSADAFYTFKVIETTTIGSVTAVSNETSEAIISGLTLRLDASDATTLFQDSAGTVSATVNNDVIGRWADKSGNARNATQATTANKPLLKTNAQNSRAGVFFDGDITINNDILEIASTVLTNFTIFTVYDALALSADLGYILGGVTQGVYAGGLAAGFDGYGAVSGGLFREANEEPLTPSVVVYQNARLFKNGAEATYSKTGTLAGLTISRVGGRPDLTTTGYQGNLYEVLVFNSTLSDANRQAVESYLNAKWVVY